MNLNRIKSVEFGIETNQKTYGVEWQNIKIRLTFLKYPVEEL